ncbi:Calcium-binding EF-hand, partial [Cynara cardunculus var. scolymus]
MNTEHVQEQGELIEALHKGRKLSHLPQITQDVGLLLILIYYPVVSIDLLASDSGVEVFELFDPSSSNVVVGKIFVSCSVEKVELYKVADVNGDGVVSTDELATLLA